MPKKNDVKQCDFDMSLSLQDFLTKSRYATNLHQHEARVSVTWDGCQVTLVQSVSLTSSGSSWCLGLRTQQFSRTHASRPGTFMTMRSTSGSGNSALGAIFLLFSRYSTCPTHTGQVKETLDHFGSTRCPVNHGNCLLVWVCGDGGKSWLGFGRALRACVSLQTRTTQERK